MTLPRSAQVWLATFSVVSVIDLTAEAVEYEVLAGLALWLLMPLLGGFLITATKSRGRLVRLALLGLVLSWLGDSVGNWIFLLKIFLFLMAQLAYVAAFLPDRQKSLLTRPLALLNYGVAIGFLIVTVSLESGSLLLPVGVYGLSVGVMAVLATGLNRLAGLGGVMFIISDTILALDTFVEWIAIPHAGFWIMLTYLSAQTLLIFGVLRAQAWDVRCWAASSR